VSFADVVDLIKGFLSHLSPPFFLEDLPFNFGKFESEQKKEITGNHGQTSKISFKFNHYLGTIHTSR